MIALVLYKNNSTLMLARNHIHIHPRYHSYARRLTSRESEAPRLAYGGRRNLGGRGGAGGGGQHPAELRTCADGGGREEETVAGGEEQRGRRRAQREREQRERAAAAGGGGRVARVASHGDDAMRETGSHAVAACGN
ncbi:hypothetical protein BDA96_10G089400 [Sorghum bicolor]|uniref:Uncharacterized protein n=1 Tax=Sorghum bicolor TaxID=4558 RepID=A0A921U0D4_SORBI|nr:hypothetical protein BDA96_10G089400 [Sorghum bicolor]